MSTLFAGRRVLVSFVKCSSRFINLIQLAQELCEAQLISLYLQEDGRWFLFSSRFTNLIQLAQELCEAIAKQNLSRTDVRFSNFMFHLFLTLAVQFILCLFFIILILLAIGDKQPLLNGFILLAISEMLHTNKQITSSLSKTKSNQALHPRKEAFPLGQQFQK